MPSRPQGLEAFSLKKVLASHSDSSNRSNSMIRNMKRRRGRAGGKSGVRGKTGKENLRVCLAGGRLESPRNFGWAEG